MTLSLLPSNPELAGDIAEAAPLLLHAKALISTQPSPNSWAFDGIVITALAAENSLNVLEAIRQSDVPAALTAASLAIAYGLGIKNHVQILRSGQAIDWRDISPTEKLASRVATVAVVAGQLFVNKRLGK